MSLVILKERRRESECQAYCKTATQRDAAEFERAARRMQKVFRDGPPKSDESYAYASTMRTFLRVVKGLDEVKSDPSGPARLR